MSKLTFSRILNFVMLAMMLILSLQLRTNTEQIMYQTEIIGFCHNVIFRR